MFLVAGPTQLRSMIKRQGIDLHAEFCALLPTPVHPIRIQRWSVRRVALIAWVLFMALLAVGLDARAALTALTAIALSGCGNAYVGADGTDPVTTPMQYVQPPGRLGGTQVLIAQAVPSTSLIPCVREEVDDWIVT